MTIKPLDDKIVVELPTAVNDRDKSSLIQLLKNHDRVVNSKVIAVGPGKVTDKGKHVPMLYEAGQIVFYPAECEKTSPRIKLDDKTEYLVLIQEQVLCYRPEAVEETAEQTE